MSHHLSHQLLVYVVLFDWPNHEFDQSPHGMVELMNISLEEGRQELWEHKYVVNLHIFQKRFGSELLGGLNSWRELVVDVHHWAKTHKHLYPV